jgi:GrpB-like predicted nucleotidyltransferase (UPF0157 family)
MLGLEAGVVKLVPYTVEWQRLFEKEKALLQTAVGDSVLDIQHVGSTAIPGMVAKPILDIGIAVTDFEEARTLVAPIGGLGYQYRGEFGIPRRHYFVKGNPRTHHIHMVEISSRDWKNQLFFRDTLIQRPELAQEYVHLKNDLARRYAADRDAYLEGKAPFIERVLAMAGSATSAPAP